ncbi:MAG TPA: hypothetical protein VHT52_17630 [Stellaceae bacterium]|jgi:hypothetical protein|nr:hypothetical protein [Stellaceae bacterium]
MTLHPNTFAYHQPSDEHIRDMAIARAAAKEYASTIDQVMPEGPDKTYALRLLRTVAMWVNVGIDRLPDGSPRT